MTQTLSNLDTFFISVDDFSNDKCRIDINIKHLQYEGGDEYYNITYQYDSDNKAHPFYKNNKAGINGTIVCKNDITKALVDYLLLEDIELAKLTGTTTPMTYRKQIIKSLDLFWD